jgi:invasion protein IalB
MQPFSPFRFSKRMENEMTFRNFTCGLVAVASALSVGDAFSQTQQWVAQAQQAPAPRAPAPKAPAPRAPATGAQPAPPTPVSPLPQATTASFGDWVVRCRRIDQAPGSATACEVAQTLQVQGRGPIAEIAFGHPPGKDSTSKERMRVVVLLPNNVTFSGPVLMSVDEKDKPVELIFRRCLPSGCFADAEPSDDALVRWRAQEGGGRLAFKDGANRDIVLPFSFRGLGQALDAMSK